MRDVTDSGEQCGVRIPLKPNGNSAAKSIKIPKETDQTSERKRKQPLSWSSSRDCVAACG
jgi:hypothetical protein